MHGDGCDDMGHAGRRARFDEGVGLKSANVAQGASAGPVRVAPGGGRIWQRYLRLNRFLASAMYH